MTKKEIIDMILADELEMFLSVKAKERSACQDNPASFKFYRGAMFSTWSKKALESYQSDVRKAKAEGKNLITLKYARMENLIPQLKNNELIDKIVTIEIAWVKEVTERYPNIHSKGKPVEKDHQNSTSTRTYLRCELETYSDQTLNLYYQNLLSYQKQGINLSEKMCATMVKGAGFKSLHEAEEHLGSIKR